jgi:hypothetical protein
MYNEQASSGRQFSCANNGILLSAGVIKVASVFCVVINLVSVIINAVIISVVGLIRKLLFNDTGYENAFC